MVEKDVLNRVAKITPKLKLYAYELLFFKTAFRDAPQMRNKDVRSEWRVGGVATHAVPRHRTRVQPAAFVLTHRAGDGRGLA